MKKNKSSKKKKPFDFSIYFPYLSSHEESSTRQPSSETIRGKKIRYSSTSTSKVEKVSKKNLIQTYLPTQQLREGLLNKKKMKQSIEKKLTREAIDMMNVSLSQFRKSFAYQRKSASNKKKEQSQKEGINNEELKTEVLSIEKQKLDETQINPLIRSKQSKNESFEEQIIFTQPLQMAFKNSFDIPGVQFKSNTQHVKKAGNLMKVAQPNSRTISLSTKSTMPRSRQSQNWERQRRVNVDSIINRKCKNFQEIMVEYYQRMQCQSATFMFSFDSHDTWIKKALLRRGWSENKNKYSKAFHLLWSYQVPKEPLFPEQMVNHYPHSHKVTTKSSLNRMLKIYKINNLQPKTFDLDLEKDNFSSDFNKIFFVKFLTEYLDHFQVQSLNEVSEDETKNALKKYSSLPIENEEEQSFLKQLKYLIFKCDDIIERKPFTVDIQKLTAIKRSLKGKDRLEQVHQKIIVVLLKFTMILENNKYIKNWLEGGKQNIWLVKSKSSSKGAGIFLSNNLSLLLRQNNRLIQKYIENVLLIESLGNRKFDIRLWVLVKGSFDAKMYYYQDFYGRVCAQPYRLDKQSLGNSAVHLTNYALNRSTYTSKGNRSGSVIFPEELFEQVKKKYDIDYEPLFYQKIEDMLSSLEPVFRKELCNQASSNNFQFFGFDLLIDSSLNVHLLEINLSAKCQERHEKLSLMLQEMAQGLLNILQDKTNKTQWKLVW